MRNFGTYDFCVTVNTGFGVTQTWKDLRLKVKCKEMSNNLTTNGLAAAESAGNNDPTLPEIQLSTRTNFAIYIDGGSFNL